MRPDCIWKHKLHQIAYSSLYESLHNAVTLTIIMPFLNNRQ